jgi:Rrf2 family iron-sulfur cluster assembly transcriptional regulator
MGITLAELVEQRNVRLVSERQDSCQKKSANKVSLETLIKTTSIMQDC